LTQKVPKGQDFLKID